jgi:hypothetical protein
MFDILRGQAVPSLLREKGFKIPMRIRRVTMHKRLDVPMQAGGTVTDPVYRIRATS